jgi:hypothetical protein
MTRLVERLADDPDDQVREMATAHLEAISAADKESRIDWD